MTLALDDQEGLAATLLALTDSLAALPLTPRQTQESDALIRQARRAIAALPVEPERLYRDPVYTTFIQARTSILLLATMRWDAMLVQMLQAAAREEDAAGT